MIVCVCVCVYAGVWQRARHGNTSAKWQDVTEVCNVEGSLLVHNQTYLYILHSLSRGCWPRDLSMSFVASVRQCDPSDDIQFYTKYLRPILSRTWNSPMWIPRGCTSIRVYFISFQVILQRSSKLIPRVSHQKPIFPVAHGSRRVPRAPWNFILFSVLLAPAPG